jgi:hypothetical protein
MEPTSSLVGHILAEKVARAQAMSPEDKFLEGPRLFDSATRVMADGIRDRYPELDDDGVERMLRVYLDRLDRVERRR